MERSEIVLERIKETGPPIFLCRRCSPADRLGVHLGPSGAIEDFDFPPRNEVHRQLRAVLSALR
jgi:hypothetical protein